MKKAKSRAQIEVDEVLSLVCDLMLRPDAKTHVKNGVSALFFA